MSENKKIIVVLGMHRSGTSAVTRGLEVLGVGLGDKLMPGIEDNNETGFWEDIDINKLNIELMHSLGHAWHSLYPFSIEDLSDDVLSSYYSRALGLLEEKLSNNKCFGIKDPRMMRLLPFWQEVFEKMGLDVGYVFVIRNPISVARSLKNRNKFSSEKSYYLWLEYIVPVLLNNRIKNKCVFVEYEAIVENPEEQLARISTALNLPLADREKLARYKNEYLDKGLQHSSFDIDALYDRENDVPELVVSVYIFLKKLAENDVSLSGDENKKILEDFYDSFLQLNLFLNEFARKDIIGYLLGVESELVVSQAENTKSTHLLSERDKLVDDLYKVVSNRNNTVNDRNRSINALTKTVNDQNNTVNNLNRTVNNLNRTVNNLKKTKHNNKVKIISLESQIEKQKNVLSEYAEHTNNLERLLKERDEYIFLLINSLSWKLTKPFRFSRRLLQNSQNSIKVWIKIKSKSIASAVWRKIPIHINKKQKIKNWFINHTSLSMDERKVKLEPSLYIEHNKNRYVPLLQKEPPENVQTKLIAFYLPQFHSIPENDEWWGKGFTEWTNVNPAKPQFAGHYQPHVSGELGTYNLLNSKIQFRQVELAKLYGLGGFCFYFYWFAGKRLLEKPVENYLNDQGLDFPFCLCWANENWSRRWDGLDSEILIAQNHSADDDIAFISYVAKYIRDKRYIRINGKPLLLVYRPSLLPSAKETALRWRKWCLDNGMGEIYLAYTQSFEAVNPDVYGFDAAVEFPPNNSLPPDITDTVQPLSQDFQSRIYDWRIFVERSKKYNKPDYMLFRSVCPSWDNTARRETKATIFLHNTPELYEAWLRNAINDTSSRANTDNEKLVFVNAWNEWAEGAHLEPDQRHGYAWLDATRRALTGENISLYKERVVVVSHDAHTHGAQFLALGIVRSLTVDFHFDVEVVVLGPGKLKEKFASFARVHDLSGFDGSSKEAVALADDLNMRGYRHAIVNSTVSGAFGATLSSKGISCVMLVHELPGIIKSYNLLEATKLVANAGCPVVFPSRVAADGFETFSPVPDKFVHIRPQGVWRRNYWRYRREQARIEVREKLGFSQNTDLVLAVGYADRRKGVDLFVQVALDLLKHREQIGFFWIGHWDKELEKEVNQMIEHADAKHAFRFLGFEPDTAIYHAAADVYALTSREDPFPNVVLESFDAGVPVVAFKNTGGGAELIESISGTVVANEDIVAFSNVISSLLDDSEKRRSISSRIMTHIDDYYAFRHYLFDLCEWSGIKQFKISVVIPNYNYARYIKERLNSIIQQTKPIFEIIILDDNSEDESVETIRDWIATNEVEAKFIINDKNSGNVFEQWEKGVSLATGDYVWIAEADDLSAVDLLETLLPPLADPSVVLSYCDSEQIDENGCHLASDYQQYYSDICEERWKKPFIHQGIDEIASALAVKNTIPNVSGVVFKREILNSFFEDSLDKIKSFQMAGDWFIYVELLKRGKVAYSPRACNIHRRHGSSVIGESKSIKLFEEITLMQKQIANSYALDNDVVTQASQYLDELKVQFGLKT